jgi:transposase
VIAPHGPANVRLLAAALNDADRSLQSLVRDIGAVYLEQISILNDKIGDLEKILRREAQRGTDTSRLQTMPGIGPMRIPTIPAKDSNLKAATIPIEGGQYWPVGMFMGSQRW